MNNNFLAKMNIIWFDPNIDSPENQSYIKKYQNVLNIKCESSMEKTITDLKNSNSKWVVITCGSEGKELVESIHSFPSVFFIIVFSSKDTHKKWTDNCPKVKKIITSGFGEVVLFILETQTNLVNMSVTMIETFDSIDKTFDLSSYFNEDFFKDLCRAYEETNDILNEEKTLEIKDQILREKNIKFKIWETVSEKIESAIKKKYEELYKLAKSLLLYTLEEIKENSFSEDYEINNEKILKTLKKIFENYKSQKVYDILNELIEFRMSLLSFIENDFYQQVTSLVVIECEKNKNDVMKIISDNSDKLEEYDKKLKNATRDYIDNLIREIIEDFKK